MNEITDTRKSFRVEISGWTPESDFFVEKAEIVEADDGEQRLLLQRDLPDGTLIFVRRPITQDASAPAPHAFKIENLRHAGAAGWEVRLHDIVRRALPRVPGRPLIVANKRGSGQLESGGNLQASNLAEDIFP